LFHAESMKPMSEEFTVLVSGPSREQVLDHLIGVETASIGVNTSDEQRNRAVDKLLELNVFLDG
jgi:hypothetical protein